MVSRPPEYMFNCSDAACRECLHRRKDYEYREWMRDHFDQASSHAGERMWLVAMRDGAHWFPLTTPFVRESDALMLRAGVLSRHPDAVVLRLRVEAQDAP